MTLYEQDSIVTFPQGSTIGAAQMLGVARVPTTDGPQPALIVDATPFHPVDHRWPDQPGDTGIAEFGDNRFVVVDSVVGAALRGTDGVSVGSEIRAKRGAQDWCWLVLHVVPRLPDALGACLVGGGVRLAVDEGRRARLSAVHTACHLSGLALNAALRALWRKEVPVDSLGSPDFERQALVSSRLSEDGYHDVYRVGRTLRKSGFDAAGLAGMIPKLGDVLSEQLAEWRSTRAPVRVAAAGSGLGDPRRWTCQLPAGNASVDCGGTHPADLGAVGEVRVSVSVAAAGDHLEIDGKVAR